MSTPLVAPTLPPALASLRTLAADVRWTWHHGTDHIWRALDPARWAESGNPWTLLQDVSQATLDRMAADQAFVDEVERLARRQKEHVTGESWFTALDRGARPRGIAFFSMEFGLSESLPLYAGGLGILAGDYLKAASDLGVPVIGIGLLYQEGYFRQTVDADGAQRELYPHNDPARLPIAPLVDADGVWQHVDLEFPGRVIRIRAWQTIVGRTRLYLLDSNDPMNSPADRGITSRLYGGDAGVRFLQEIVLGVGGWRLIDSLGVDVDVCHLNEGHAALAVLERARCFMVAATRHDVAALSFREALWATRGGNVFTTHTAVAAAFDRFTPDFLDHSIPFLREYAKQLGVWVEDLLALGRSNPDDANEPFNLAYLAMRGSAAVNGVSALHERVSQTLFQPLFPRWPEREVPITHVTNGVHMPSWDSMAADAIWETHCGKGVWLGMRTDGAKAIAAVGDEQLWAYRAHARRTLVAVVRRRIVRQLQVRGAPVAATAAASRVLDPDALTLGFARRFTEYKRPTMLLTDRSALLRLLSDRHRPVQLIVAGKAHPDDAYGKDAIREWVQFAQDRRVRDRLVFLEDYDIAIAQELVAGVDVWLNTPRRPWEACGTSGMKVLVNGGLNLSERDGWWHEAYSPTVGWAIGDDASHDDAAWDTIEAEELYDLLEHEIVPDFFARDAGGLPRRWLARVRASMAELTPRFSATRMIQEYVEALYVPASRRFADRTANAGRLARELSGWSDAIGRSWNSVSFGEAHTCTQATGFRATVAVELADLQQSAVRVELYAEAIAGEPAEIVSMRATGERDDRGRQVYEALVVTNRPAEHYTVRVVPHHRAARVPAEVANIHWQR
jgi:starch phosphorylase